MATRQRLTSDEWLAKKVLEILVGCELIKTGTSLVGGQNFYFPQVVEVVDIEPTEVAGRSTTGLILRILPGQAPHHFTAHAQTIAYNLGMAEVRVFPLEAYLILLELVPKPAPHGQPGSY